MRHLVLTICRYTSTEFTELSNLQTNIAALTKPRLPRFLARLQQPKKRRDVHPFQKYEARNRLFVKFETLIEELIETRPLVKDQLCSVCDKYEWIIPPGADDLRLNAQREGYTGYSGPSGSGKVVDTDGSEKQPLKSVWLAEELPSGSLFHLLTRPQCRICMLVLHLMTPLPIKSLLSWAVDQPLSVLHGFQYTMQYQQQEKILVRTRQPLSDVWQEAGVIEMKNEVKDGSGEDSHEQSLVWESTNLSRKKLMNSSWMRTTDVDYALVNYWLRRCSEYHEHCHVTRSQGRKDIRIRLIDVVDQCVVHGTLANRYFALSYVWGGIERLKATKDNIKELEQKDALRMRSASIPRSVLDAMTFVARLSQRYLWVDSLCIIQDDRAEKHDQIALMHEIYTSAYATIVQHSGCDANAGLPGVREGSRSLIATKTHVNDRILIAKANYSTPKVLSSSVHSTRGWTLQEVLLSTRCLHFFNKHLTFVCGEEWAQDWNVQYSNQDPSTQVGSGELSRVSHRLWQMNPFSLTRTDDGRERDAETTRWLRHFDIYGRILTDYTIRSLSFESDTLPAFQGLGGAITRLNGARFHFGVPSNCFDLALLWINLGPGERRTSRATEPVPSWTWAAWTGQSTYNLCDLSGDPSHPYFINSFVQNFYVKEDQRSIEIVRQELPRKNSDVIEPGTPYFDARRAIADPPPDPRLIEDLPYGCLHFWAEECTMDQISVNADQAIATIETRVSKKRCGVLALPTNFHNNESASSFSGAEYSLVLMSESRKVLPYWIFGAQGIISKTRMATTTIRVESFDYPDWYHDGARNRAIWMFNVLLIKRTGPFFKRIAFGQIHMLAWLELKRRRRYVRLT
ncbi:hypothetical protein N0V90_001071 [Kalmusia sp. IMI 367209]|nr:hypothetical protein N0V90_001071 [Kalmusia sp. IMI 367209]